MSLSWGPMQKAISESVKEVKTQLQKVSTSASTVKMEATAKLQWDMAIMQQVLQASSNVTEGCLSTVKNAIGNMNR